MLYSDLSAELIGFFVNLNFGIFNAYEKNSAGKYNKRKTSDFYEKCNAYVCKSCFKQYHTHSQPKRKWIA